MKASYPTSRQSVLPVVRAPGSSRGFTLVELLTVIAIIGILAGILIPVIGKVRASARTAACTVNLRHAHNWLTLYSQDHKGRYPAPFGPNLDTPNNSANGSWWQTLQLYFQPRYETPAVGETDAYLNPWYCAAAEDTYPNGVRRVYPINADGAPANQYLIPAQNEKPAKTLLVADGSVQAGNTDSWAYFRSSASAPGIVLDPRHNGKVNGIFLDGHVAAFSMDDPQLDTWIRNLRN